MIRGLAIALAISLLANLWLFHARDVALEREGAQAEAVKNVSAAAEACSASVDGLGKDSRARFDRLERRLDLESGRVISLQHEANEALQARPADAGDLCGSLLRFWRAGIAQERARTRQEPPR